MKSLVAFLLCGLFLGVVFDIITILVSLEHISMRVGVLALIVGTTILGAAVFLVIDKLSKQG